MPKHLIKQFIFQKLLRPIRADGSQHFRNLFLVYFSSSVQMEMLRFIAYVWKHWSCLLSINTIFTLLGIYREGHNFRAWPTKLLMHFSAWRDWVAVRSLLRASCCFLVALVPEKARVSLGQRLAMRALSCSGSPMELLSTIAQNKLQCAPSCSGTVCGARSRPVNCKGGIMICKSNKSSRNKFLPLGSVLISPCPNQ